MQGFEYASIIRGKNGLWLAIPTDAIPKKARGKRMTPGLYEQMKGVRLQFVYRRNACSLLVHTKKKKTVIAFILVPQVKMPKLINFESESERWQNKVPSLILQNWSEDE